MEKKGILKGYTMTKGVLIGAVIGLIAIAVILVVFLLLLLLAVI